MKLQNYINHIIFCIDASSSMEGLAKQVVKVFDSQIQYLAKRSREMDQESRCSVYLFHNTVEPLVFNMDVLRMPSLSKYYKANGMTALIDGVLAGIEDGLKIPELYGDYATILYCLSDGGENHSKNTPNKLLSAINKLPENWTVACFVPDKSSATAAKNVGFPIGNVEVWDVSERGLEEVGEKITKTTESYMVARSTGFRGTKSLFSLNTDSLKPTAVKQALDELKPSSYDLVPVRKDVVIKDYIEDYTKRPYVAGSVYYPLTKRETIQSNKQIIVMNKQNGKLFGGLNARQLLGLPNHEVKVSPTHAEFEIFVQSTSNNRKLLKGWNVVVLK